MNYSDAITLKSSHKLISGVECKLDSPITVEAINIFFT